MTTPMPPGRGGVLALTAFLSFAALASAWERPKHLPHYDVRSDTSAKSAAVLAAARGATAGSASRRGALAKSMSDAEAKLSARVARLRVQRSPTAGVAEVIDTEGGAPLTSNSGENREAVARRFVQDNAAVFGMSAREAAELRAIADYSNPAGNLSWVELEQTINGIPVFQGRIRAAIRKDGAIARTTGTLAAGIGDAALPAIPAMTPTAALAAGARAIGVEIDPAGVPKPSPEDDGRTHLFPQGTFDAPVKVQLTYFPTEPGVATLAYSMVLWEPVNAYWVLVDAQSGELLWRKCITNDQTQSATFSVYGSDSPAPLSPTNATPGSGIQGTGVARSSFTLISELPAFDNLGWIPDGGNTTTGNNVDAGLDLTSPDGIDTNGRATGSPNRVFSFTYSPGGTPGGQEPIGTAYRMGAVTNLFFWSNRYHDRMYSYGFTEAAGNFQQNNFARGGQQNDRVLAEAQDGSGTDNANFSTPPDGSSGRMQMFIFTGPTPARDGDLDQEIVIHELTHGLSNRLHANASGLNTLQSGGMGEGWSDFYARCLLATADEDVAGIYASGGYSTRSLGGIGSDNYYYGIRRFPYAIKTTVGANGKPHNPLTFADIDPAQAVTKDGAFPQSPVFGNTAIEVHNIGEIWCMALLEVRARIIGRLGFAAGTDRILQIVTDGMKLDPASPTLIQARDSILAADVAGFAGVDVDDIWAGFAAVGLGFNASVTNTATQPATVVESFQGPNLILGAVTFTDAGGNNNGFADPGETLTLNVPLTNLTATVASAVTADVTGGGSGNYDSIAAGATATRTISFTVPPGTPSGTRLKTTVAINSSFGPVGPAAASFFLTVGQPITGFSQNFDGLSTPALPPGWTTATSGSGAPWIVSITNPDTPTRAVATGNATSAGSSELVTPSVAITSPSARLTFRNSYNLEINLSNFAYFDGFVLEVSVDGAPFADVVEAGCVFLSGGYNASIEFSTNPLGGRNAWSGLSGGTTSAPAYITTSVLLPPTMNGHSVRFKWRVGTDESVAAAGLSGARIDGVSIANGTLSVPVDGAPVVTTTAGSATFVENQAPTAIDPAVIVTDPDSANLAGATVAISANFVGTEDVLSFTPQSGITGSFSGDTGVLTLTGSASLAAYTSALQSVMYGNFSENPSPAARVVTYTVNDGANTGSGSRNLVVAAVNDAPTLDPIADPPSIPMNSGVQTFELAGITAGGGETQVLTVTAVSGSPDIVPDPTVTYSSPSMAGSISFTPLAGASGVALISVVVADDGGTANGGVNTITRTFTVRIGDSNDPPTFLVGPNLVTPQDAGAQVVTGWATAIDPGGPDETEQTVHFLIDVDNASLFTAAPTIDSAGTLSYSPNPAGSGVATVTVRAQDDGGTANGGDDTSEPQTFQIAIASFAEELGTFVGLVEPAPAGPRENARAGSVQAKLSRKGRFTGRVTLAGKRSSFKGAMENDGIARFGRSGSTTFEIKRRHDSPLTLSLALDVANGTDVITGSVKSGANEFGVITADRSVYSSRRHPKPPLQNPPDELLGAYTVVLAALTPAAQGQPASSFPQGDGFARIVVKKNGVAKLSGRLADGSRIGGAAPIAKLGRWPLYDGMRHGGSVHGFANFRDIPGQTDVDASGFLWFRSANSRARQYPLGWPNGIFVAVAGSKYNAPSRRSLDPVLPGLSPADSDGNAELILSDGGLAGSPLIQALVIDPKNKSKALAPTLEKFKFKLSEKSGLFDGSFEDPATGKRLKFGGAVLQKQQLGSGYFLGTEESGGVALAPDPTPGIP